MTRNSLAGPIRASERYDYFSRPGEDERDTDTGRSEVSRR